MLSKTRILGGSNEPDAHREAVRPIFTGELYTESRTTGSIQVPSIVMGANEVFF